MEGTGTTSIEILAISPAAGNIRLHEEPSLWTRGTLERNDMGKAHPARRANLATRRGGTHSRRQVLCFEYFTSNSFVSNTLRDQPGIRTM